MTSDAARFTTARPDRKKGVTLPRTTYEYLRNRILSEIRNADEVTTAQLIERMHNVEPGMPNVENVILHVKLDLECRGYLQSKPSSTNPRLHVIRLSRKGARMAASI